MGPIDEPLHYQVPQEGKPDDEEAQLGQVLLHGLFFLGKTGKGRAVHIGHMELGIVALPYPLLNTEVTQFCPGIGVEDRELGIRDLAFKVQVQGFNLILYGGIRKANDIVGEGPDAKLAADMEGADDLLIGHVSLQDFIAEVGVPRLNRHANGEAACLLEQFGHIFRHQVRPGEAMEGEAYLPPVFFGKVLKPIIHPVGEDIVVELDHVQTIPPLYLGHLFYDIVHRVPPDQLAHATVELPEGMVEAVGARIRTPPGGHEALEGELPHLRGRIE